MSATQGGAVTAIAFQLLAALETYAREAGQLTRDQVDPEAYHRMRLQLDAMRHQVLDVPGLGASWVELLIRHFELAHVRWKLDQGHVEATSVHAVAAEHGAAVTRLRTLCSVAIQRDTRATV